MKVDHLIGRVDLEHVVLPALGVVVAKKTGSELLCHCPDLMGNHSNGDANPSFTTNEDKLVYNCFVCGGGSLVKLVQDVFAYDEPTALLWLEEHSNLAPSTSEDFADEIERLLAQHREQLEPFPEYPEDHLFQFEGFHPWLSDRGISREVAKDMQVGWDDTHCGIVFPHVFGGRLVGIQTRHLAMNARGQFLCPAEGVGVPKYKNSTRFPRKHTLYNYDHALEYERVIVVESPMTVLYLKSCGYQHVVATFGAGLAPGQAQLLYVFHGGVFVWPDNDGAGDKTLSDALVMLERYVPMFIIPAVPGEKSDPADLQPEEIPHYIDAAYPSVLYPIDGIRVGVPHYHKQGVENAVQEIYGVGED